MQRRSPDLRGAGSPGRWGVGCQSGPGGGEVVGDGRLGRPSAWSTETCARRKGVEEPKGRAQAQESEHRGSDEAG